MNCNNCGAPLVATSAMVECPYCHGLNQSAPVILAQALRIETINDIATVIIPRWSALPASYINIFSTGMDEQQAVNVRILQGDSEKLSLNRNVEVFTFDGILPAPRATPQIQFRFEVAEDGILLVTAENLGTGKKITFPSMHLDILKKTDTPPNNRK